MYSESDKQDGKRCFNCGNKNHLSALCPDKEKGVKCFQCGEYGHIAIKCPKAEGEKITVKDIGSCYAASSTTEKYCKIVTINGVELSALIDTSSDISLIRADAYIKVGAPTLTQRRIEFRVYWIKRINYAWENAS